jgi:hypothetical protein
MDRSSPNLDRVVKKCQGQGYQSIGALVTVLGVKIDPMRHEP